MPADENQFSWTGKSPEEIAHNLREKFRGGKSPLSSGIRYALILAVIIAAFTSFYTIDTNEVGVVLRLGKFARITQPGLHLKLPYGLEQVYPVRIAYNYKEEFGYRTATPGVRTTYRKQGYNDESLMLTGDLNVLDVEWIVQFNIKNPYHLLFKIHDTDRIFGDPSENVRKTLRDLSESVMRKVVGNYTLDEVLYKSNDPSIAISDKVHSQLQDILDSYEAGVDVVTVKLQDVTPPDPVKPAFHEVNEARQEKEQMINQAWKVYNQKIPEVKGKALKIVERAEGYALERVNRAKGEAKRFLLLREAYAKAEKVTRRRLYLENMKEILQKAGKKYIVDPEQKGILPLLKLGNEQ
ncbi:MAG: FtsH protease activity modulator HflK [Candidatus Omnitrophica bacterium]|nr:FtsH protease activity modulator HflK [Candidatus Omnitrophota bacterium]